MRVLIIGFGVMVGCIGIFMACGSIDRGKQKETEVQRLEAEIVDLKQKIIILRDFPQREPVPLHAAYTAFMNDIYIMAGAHRVTCTVSVQSKDGVDTGKNAGPAEFSGLKEVHFHGTFAGVARRTALLSLLDALAAFEKGSAVLFRHISHEKDILAFDVTVVGL